MTVRALGVDPGEARIGLALSDALGVTAQPLERLDRRGSRKDLNRIAEVARRHEAAVVVVGLPKTMAGEEREAAHAARELAEGLRRRLPGVRVVMWDERLTTVMAERTMVAADVRRRKRRERIDSLAAVLILQNWLDSGGLERVERDG